MSGKDITITLHPDGTVTDERGYLHASLGNYLGDNQAAKRFSELESARFGGMLMGLALGATFGLTVGWFVAFIYLGWP